MKILSPFHEEWLFSLLHLWANVITSVVGGFITFVVKLNVITFMVSITFMVNFITFMVGITFMVFITVMGDRHVNAFSIS